METFKKSGTVKQIGLSNWFGAASRTFINWMCNCRHRKPFTRRVSINRVCKSKNMAAQSGRIASLLLLCLVSAGMTAAPLKATGQISIQIGVIAFVPNMGPTTWGMSGMEMVRISHTSGNVSPVSRTMAWDARTVEILSNTQSPPLTGSDIRMVKKDGRYMVVVREYLLMEVLPEDAAAAGTSTAALAEIWTKAIRKVLPEVAPMGSRVGGS